MVEMSIFRTYLQESSFHGFKFLAEDNRHWTERIFWLICIILSWAASVVLILASWDDFQHNAISFVVETSYLEWDTQFPSFAVCEYDNQKRIAEVTDKLYGDPHDYNLDEIVKELVYFRGLSYYTIQLCGTPNAEPNPNCLKSNFSFYSSMVRSNCTETFRSCRWNDEVFDCCSHFLPIDTELGLCYAINSQQSRNMKRFLMTSNKKDGPGNLHIEVYNFINIYILGGQEVPSLTTLQTDILQVSPHIHYHRYIAIKEIENQPEVKDVSVEQRNCRYGDENYLNVYPYYSYSACSVQCRKNAQLRLCNCTHHLMPNAGAHELCNLTGMACLNDNYNELAVLKAHWSKRTGLVCNCMPSCQETEMFLIKDEKLGIDQDYAIIEFTLERLPSERFKRNVVRGKLDLVVSIGGTAALFMGSSLLSFVEIFYYFLLRLFCNIMRRGKEKRQMDIQLKNYPFLD